MFKWLWKWYGGSLGDNEEKATINPNSMSPLPLNRFNNLARIKGEVDEDPEPHKDVYQYHRMKRLKHKRIKQIMNEENILERNFNFNPWFYNRYRR